MLKHFYTLLASTFLIGLLSGVFVYFISRGPVESEGPKEVPEGEFEIIADMYGGCSMLGGCASYRIQHTGSYTYIERSRTADSIRHEGTLSQENIDDLRRLLERADLDGVLDSTFSGTCPAAYDRTAYRFEIEFGREYRFDSCLQDLEGQQLFEALSNHFEILKP